MLTCEMCGTPIQLSVRIEELKNEMARQEAMFAELTARTRKHGDQVKVLAEEILRLREENSEYRQSLEWYARLPHAGRIAREVLAKHGGA